MLYYLACSSALITIGVKPVNTQRASLDVVRNAFVIFMFMRRCILLYTVLLHSFSSTSFQTITPYNRSGKIAALYMVFRASWLSPQHCFADFDRACINFMHFLGVYVICSLKFNLLSMIIPRYLNFWTCSKGLFVCVCMYVCMYVCMCVWITYVLYEYVCMCMYVVTCVCMNVCVCVCVFIGNFN